MTTPKRRFLSFAFTVLSLKSKKEKVDGHLKILDLFIVNAFNCLSTKFMRNSKMNKDQLGIF